jgi:hypothetical protein
MTIADSFDRHTMANMEVALECVCKDLPKSYDNYEARRYIASRIIGCAQGGDGTLDGLTVAGRSAASELTSSNAA